MEAFQGAQAMRDTLERLGYTGRVIDATLKLVETFSLPTEQILFVAGVLDDLEDDAIFESEW